MNGDMAWSFVALAQEGSFTVVHPILPRYPSAAKVRNLIRIQKRCDDIQEIAYRLALVETS